MILNFFNQWLMTGDYPEKLIDDNVRTDYGRLNRLIANEKNRQVVEGILAEEGITTDIVTRFSFDRMYDQEYFVSLLYYMGLLTIKGVRYGKTRLGIPNHVTRMIFWEYFERKLRDKYNIKYDTEELAKSIWQLGFDGEIEPFVSYVSENVLNRLSNRDLINFDEKYIKVILFSYLITSNLYHPISEPEIESGYLDIFLERDIRMPDVKYEWIIELKYLKKNQRDEIEKVKEKGLTQLQRYADSRKFKDKKDVKKVLLVFIGKDEFKILTQ
ncbi:PD-(D/E)XK nuclease domain-containing protein [Iocasia frigidifontis]|uniref:PD-(D/E)XK nuclease domain-containing protein n=1 Tax=Iocasia fonsfrigidae TaxID=2682810 RepID=UPI001E635357|nr:PD-(D/E)XK nuclease domain-containing protein [Iocasia fonsfrigidae]